MSSRTFMAKVYYDITMRARRCHITAIRLIIILTIRLSRREARLRATKSPLSARHDIYRHAAEKIFRPGLLPRERQA